MRNEMWPFGDAVKKEAAQLRAFRDIGETFKLDGKTYRVKDHTQYLPMVGLRAVLVCEYRHEPDTLLTRTFGVNNLEELQRQNPAASHLD
jgi:hypothetical protein